MWDFKHDCLRNTFLNIHPKIIFADIQGFTLLFVPLWNIFGFFRQIYRKTIILSILEMVMTAIIIIYGANLSRVVCILCGGVELPAATHIAVSVLCVLFVSEYHRVPNVFLFIFSSAFLPPSDHGWHCWMLSHYCFQARGLSQ